MKLTAVVCFFLLPFAMVVGLFNLPVKAESTPIIIVGDEEKEGGYLVDITREAFLQVGYAPTFRYVPWARALHESKEGKADMLLAAYYTNDRAEVFHYSKPIGTAKVFLLKRSDHAISYSTVNDLIPYRIGHIRGSKVNPEFDAAESTVLTMVYARDAEMNIRLLLDGRIDLVVEKEQILNRLLKTVFRNEAPQLEVIFPPLQINNFHNCVRKTHPDALTIIDNFNRGLRMIKANGVLTSILNRHGLSAETPP